LEESGSFSPSASVHAIDCGWSHCCYCYSGRSRCCCCCCCSVLVAAVATDSCAWADSFHGAETWSGNAVGILSGCVGGEVSAALGTLDEERGVVVMGSAAGEASGPCVAMSSDDEGSRALARVTLGRIC